MTARTIMVLATTVAISSVAACGGSSEATAAKSPCDDDMPGSGCAASSGGEATAQSGRVADQRSVEYAQHDHSCAEKRVYFDVDSANLSSDARHKLDAIAECINSGAVSELEITGSADPRGAEPYNQELGEQRARAVKTYLQAKGVEDAKYHVRSVGEQGSLDKPSEWKADRNAAVKPAK